MADDRTFSTFSTKTGFGNDNLLILLGMRVRSHAETMLQSTA